jgi:hypothetical protein
MMTKADDGVEFEPGVKRTHPEDVAAIVNGLLVLVTPVAVSLAASLGFFDSSDAVVAVVSTPGERFARSVSNAATTMAPFVPLAFIAGWRTWEHARRVRRGQSRGWGGVLEGGLLGFVLAILLLAGSIARRPFEAPPYVLAYGGAAAVIGLTVGFVLRLTGLAAMRLSSSS